MAILLARFCRDAVEFGCVWDDSRHLPPVIGVYNRQRRVANLCGCCKSNLFAVFQSEVLSCLRDTCILEWDQKNIFRPFMQLWATENGFDASIHYNRGLGNTAQSLGICICILLPLISI